MKYQVIVNNKTQATSLADNKMQANEFVNSKNVANNVAQREMQDLTEKWKNGELKEGWYYLSIVPSKKCIDYFIGQDFERYNEWAIEEVLAPVPDYNHFVDLTEKANQFSQMVKKVDELVTKCHRLEELLKRCRDSVEFDKREALGGGADYQAKILSVLLKEIDEVLK